MPILILIAWRTKLLIALVAIVAVGGLFADWYSAAPLDAHAKATYVGRQTCLDCHQNEHAEWTGSHHDLAMDVATDESVLGDFNDATFERKGLVTRFFRDGERFMVNTEGPDGELTDFEVKYTFGVDPLQQYMVQFDDGRVQVLRVSWDTHRQKWFYLPLPDAPDERLGPDDPFHWTGVFQNWNTTCAVCHSTNLQKNYDLASDSFRTTWSEIDVSCEECHGPASLHVELASAKSLFWDRRHGYGLANLKSEDASVEIESCAKCHSRRDSVHPRFRPGEPLLDFYQPSRLTAPLYHADGQILDEVYVHGSFLQSKMHAQGVRCTDCHNPHSLKPKFEGNALCAQCHQPAKYDVESHHHHPPGSIGAQCVECHMPATTYMVVDPRRDHSLRVPRPDLTVSIGTPNACNGCHNEPGDSAVWAAAKIREWFGDERKRLPDDLPEWAPAIAAGRAADPSGEELLAKLCRHPRTPSIVHATALELLQQYDGPAASQAIESGLTSLDPLVRVAATESARDPSPAALAAKLGERLLDSSRAVRIAAGQRLSGPLYGDLSPSKLEAYRSAIREYREQQQQNSEVAGAHMNLSNLALREQNVEAAIDELRTAVRLEPYLAGPRGMLASLLEQTKGSPGELRKLREEEVARLKRDAEFFPTNADLVYRRGLLEYKLGELAAAGESLARACRLAPDSYRYWLTLAVFHRDRYRETGTDSDLQTAIEALKEMNRLRADDAQAKAIVGELLEAQREFQDSEDTP